MDHSFDHMFSAIMAQKFSGFGDGGAVAVAVSGGPDSMALAYMMEHWARGQGKGVALHAITVDHRLRPEAADEARQVGVWLSALPGVVHHNLIWEYQEKPQSRMQEQARHARYHLMSKKMKDIGVRHLFTAHHRDDQAETFLFRLAKGSGLDGLACMAARQDMGADMVLCRPLLDFSKRDLVAYCQTRGISYVDDPSNQNNNFARVRLRKSMAVLEEEGLSAKRLGVTAARLARARAALEVVAHHSYETAILNKKPDRIEFKFDIIKNQPEEIGLRVLLLGFKALRGADDYGVRMEKIENLFSDLMKPEPFRKRTLGGLLISRDDNAAKLILENET